MKSHLSKEYKEKEKEVRWFLDRTSGVIVMVGRRVFYSYENHEDWFEIQESDLPYWQNRPEGVWEIRIPKKGEVIYTRAGYIKTIVFTYKGYFWCKPLGDRFDAMADDIEGIICENESLDGIIAPIAAYLREQLEGEVQS